MMWIRRLSTIPLIIIFFILFPAVLVITTINDTAGNPEFYNDQMVQVDAYNFVYDEMLPTALDETETGYSLYISLTMSDLNDEIVLITREILPPEWLQAQFESTTNAVIPYVLGDTAGFTYTIAIKERVEATADAIKDDVLQGDVFTNVYNEEMSQLATLLSQEMESQSFSLVLGKEQLQDLLTTVFSQDWVELQIENVIDSVTPYITGDTEHFTITIDLEERLDVAEIAIVDLLSEQDTYEAILDNLTEPIISDNMALSGDLPYGITLDEEEVADAIKEALPQSWVEAQFGTIVNSVFSYVKGESSSIQAKVELSDRKNDIQDALVELVDEELQTVFYSLPVCTTAKFLQIMLTLPPNTLPDCRPSGISYEEALTLLNIDIADSVEQTIDDQIPDQWVYTEEALFFADDSGDILDDAREWVSQGFTFTDEDVADSLGRDGEMALEQVRDWIDSGYTLTEIDLRAAMSDADVDMQAFDEMRYWTGIARTWLWALWLVPLLLLVAIGLLGGRDWMSKLAWALAVLLIASLFVYVTVGITYSSFGEPQTYEIMLESSEYSETETLLINKGNEIIESAVDSCVSQLRNRALYMTIGSSAILLVVIFWRIRRSSQETEQPSPPNGADSTSTNWNL